MKVCALYNKFWLMFIVIGLFLIIENLSGVIPIACATLEGPVVLGDFSLDKKANLVKFIEYNGTHQTASMFGCDLDTGKTKWLEAVETTPPKAEYPLKSVDLNKMKISFKAELDSKSREFVLHAGDDDFIWKEERLSKYYPGASSVYNWKVTVSIPGKAEKIVTVGACDTCPTVCFSGLSYPGYDFIFIIARTVCVCNEGGYNCDFGFFISGLSIPEECFSTAEADNSWDSCFLNYEKIHFYRLKIQ